MLKKGAFFGGYGEWCYEFYQKAYVRNRVGNIRGDGSVIGTTIQDRYKVLSCIGEGGMGVVYEVEHVLIGLTITQ
jgi:hypothetical protein